MEQQQMQQMQQMSANMNMLMNMVAQQRSTAPAQAAGGDSQALQQVVGRVDALESENRQLSSELREQDNRIKALETASQEDEKDLKDEDEENVKLKAEVTSESEALKPVKADLEAAKKVLKKGAVFLSQEKRTDLDKEESKGVGFAMRTFFHQKKIR